MDIYVKSAMKCSLSNRKYVCIKDIAEIVADQSVANKINALKILNIPSKQQKTSYLVSITDIIRAIQKEYPDATINNVGAEDILIEYTPKEAKGNSTLRVLKAIFVCMILFAGAATAIMSFYADAELNKVFEQFYYMVFGYKSSSPLIIQIPYAIGLTFGIILFFNHFGGKKITGEPTPLEVEMSVYESEVTEAVIDGLNTKKKDRQSNNS